MLFKFYSCLASHTTLYFVVSPQDVLKKAPVILSSKISTMPVVKQRITNCLWFDSNAEEAANFYTSIFSNSRILRISRYGNEGQEIHGGKPGSVLVVSFELDGQQFEALNGGPIFKFNEAVSLIVNCETQEEIDYYWEKLTEGGKESSCGWLKDKFGVSWQVVPVVLGDMMTHPDSRKSERVMKAFLQMKKFDLKKLEEEFAR